MQPVDKAIYCSFSSKLNSLIPLLRLTISSLMLMTTVHLRLYNLIMIVQNFTN